jgi:hypothetical protein
MAGKPNPLDQTLDNITQGMLALSSVVKQELQSFERAYSQDGSAYNLEELARIAERHAKTTALYIEMAPFFDAKQRLEAIDYFRNWLLTSSEWVGERRETVLECLTSIEQAVIQDVTPGGASAALQSTLI